MMPVASKKRRARIPRMSGMLAGYVGLVPWRVCTPGGMARKRAAMVAACAVSSIVCEGSSTHGARNCSTLGGSGGGTLAKRSTTSASCA